MATKLETWLILLLMPSFLSLQYFVVAKPQVPCYFIFGDSAVDNGNNLALHSLAKANFKPYGIDLPAGVPTGRFTNGRTSTDLLAELLGFTTYPPPYVTASGKEILTGVNYGSSGAGIRKESGRHLTLYNFGAKKIVIFSLERLGCAPVVVAEFGGHRNPDDASCVEHVNRAAELFNGRLMTLVDELNTELPDAKFKGAKCSMLQAADGHRWCVDNGNNLGLKSTGKADFPPYGIDLPSGVPTGRFTNGRTTTDLLAELLGFNTYPPPYVTGDRFTMDEQLKNHLLIASRIADILGSNEAATKHLNKCIYSLTLGSNDFVGNYFARFFPTRELYTIQRWCDVVIKRYGQQLRVSTLHYNFSCPPFPDECGKHCLLPTAAGHLGFLSSRRNACEDRDDYVFWDGFHTSEAVNKIIANKSYTSISPDGVYPINIAQLAKLQI
ncbi:hypothetical protein C3L33_06126, partial [Rhododendron williamsianum]